MLKKKSLAIVLLLSMIILSLSGCSQLLERFENEEVRAYTEGMLDAIIDKDFDTAYSFVQDVYSEDEFAQQYNEMESLLCDVKSYELTLVGFNNNVNVTNGKKLATISASYTMTENDKEYVVFVSTSSNYEKLSSFDVKLFEDTSLYTTGNINNMAQASLFQWIMILTNVVSLALMLFAVVDCSKHKINKKALWIIFIVLGLISFRFSFGPEMIKLNFYLGMITNYSAFIKYGNGSFVLRLMIPLGAIVYLIVRKRLIKKASTPPQQPQMPDYPQYPQETTHKTTYAPPEYKNSPVNPQSPYIPPQDSNNE